MSAKRKALIAMIAMVILAVSATLTSSILHFSNFVDTIITENLMEMRDQQTNEIEEQEVHVSQIGEYFLIQKTKMIWTFIAMGFLITAILLAAGMPLFLLVSGFIAAAGSKRLDLVHYDALTSIYNRRFFDENLKRIINSLSRSHGTLSLMMIDVDCFKRYNDTYGHNEGDNCLISIATVLSESIERADDFVARYGGEEFVAVMPNTDEYGALIIANRMLEGIENCGILHEKNDAANHVTVSIGVTTGRVNRTQSGEDYIKRADEMLYESKRNGRNRYTFAVLQEDDKAKELSLR